jgi:hypothetical protein
MSDRPRLPWWLKYANRVIIPLNRLGLALGTQHVLTVPGRKTGRPHSTPVSLLTVDGRRYICSLPGTDWVKNARAAGWGILARGRRRERIALVELPAEERVPVLREFPRQVPHGVQFFVTVGAVRPPADPEAFAAAAPLLTVIRIDPPPTGNS